MLDSGILDVILGLSFIYLLLSLLAAAINEWIAYLTEARAVTLEKGVANLLQDQQLKERVYAHPLLAGLRPPAGLRGYGRRLPSHIPGKLFASALLDVILAPTEADSPTDSHQSTGGATAEQRSPDLARALAQSNLLEPAAKQALHALLQQGRNDLDGARESVGRWFDQGMEQVSEWYRRKSQLVVLIIAFVATVTLNVDTLAITEALTGSSELRSSVAGAATGFLESEPSEEGSDATGEDRLRRVAELDKLVQGLGLPLGWCKDTCLGGSDTTGAAAAALDPRSIRKLRDPHKYLGLLVTLVAISFGAPFWFEAVKRLVNVRGAGGEPRPRQGPAAPAG